MKETISKLVSNAIEAKASDIHIEPREEFVRVRFRIDGILEEQETMPKSQQSPLISAIKVMVNLDVAESRVPQDGRHNFRHKKKHYDLRASTLPTIHGEKIVIRILERGFIQIGLDDIGFCNEDLILYRKMISKRSGMILIIGPTGSGKTTTLYASLNELNNKEYNIVAVEDPIEYKLPGINQVQVNNKSGLSFPKILRAVLRQDPDIILIGEIRDLETARIAVQAALTGHLVLSTLHTKDAKGAATRLVELGIEDYLVRDVLIGTIAQRLVRVKPSGRRAIFELMTGFEPQENMRTLKDEAKKLLDEGLTTRDEILRVLEID
ncbi:type II/IV secretion system protein [Candidatus Saganbacteria bacterium]|nr:type II/IV secretion system protein [Candidatus Saganbacteria bacterium]